MTHPNKSQAKPTWLTEDLSRLLYEDSEVSRALFSRPRNGIVPHGTATFWQNVIECYAAKVGNLYSLCHKIHNGKKKKNLSLLVK
jgi:hypothetical protein